MQLNHVGLIGYGEVGKTFALGLLEKSGVVSVAAWDLKLSSDAPLSVRQAELAHAKIHGIQATHSMAALCVKCQFIISAVTASNTLAVAQDIHWGRTYESFSEDPAIVASYAAGYVRGVQHDLGTDGVIACAKHWVGDGGTTSGNDQGDTAISEEELERTHMAPYYPALDAGLLTVMASFNSWNGDKCHGHRYLLTDVLKGRLGFDGLVVSDWDGVDYLHEDYGTAIGMAANAGIDVFMVSLEWKQCLALLLQQVEAGIVPMARIDDAVRRILSVKLRFGLFEKPRPADRAWSNSDTFGCAAHREVAREAVRKSLVLLKNEEALLPLSRAARILVAGKSAHNRGHQCGGFTVAWQGETTNDAIVGGTSIWEGIHALAPMATLDETGASADPAHHDVAIVVIGGLGSIIGAFVAAVLVSELIAFGILIFPKISIILVFLVMAVVLIVRPWGLFGKPEAAARRTPGLTVNPWRPLTSGERLLSLGALAMAGTRDLDVSTMCATFAETEIISLLAEGAGREDVAASVHSAIAHRVLGLVAQVGKRPTIVMTGGVAQNRTAGSMLYMPSRVARLFGSGIPGSMQTRSPTFNVVTDAPHSITVPEASWPRIIGAFTSNGPILPWV